MIPRTCLNNESQPSQGIKRKRVDEQWQNKRPIQKYGTEESPWNREIALERSIKLYEGLDLLARNLALTSQRTIHLTLLNGRAYALKDSTEKTIEFFRAQMVSYVNRPGSRQPVNPHSPIRPLVELRCTSFEIYTRGHAQFRQICINFASTSMQRHDVASTLKRRCINVMYPLNNDSLSRLTTQNEFLSGSAFCCPYVIHYNGHIFTWSGLFNNIIARATQI